MSDVFKMTLAAAILCAAVGCGDDPKPTPVKSTGELPKTGDLSGGKQKSTSNGAPLGKTD